jgi:salicylate hydroxylase
MYSFHHRLISQKRNHLSRLHETMAPLQIAIIGEGIGGPATAIGLAKNEHQVTIYERSTSASEVGYAFWIAAESDHCLKYLGINTISQGAVSSNNVPTVDPDGKTTRLFDGNKDGKRRENGTSVFAFRPQLNR